MDRRQRKTREAIFHAFTELLAKNDVSRITVGQIIQQADVGRATFYAHFETKEFLLEALCQELFGHIFDQQGEHKFIFACDAPDSVFLHLFQHLQKNDNHILQLLTCPNNEVFLQYFKKGLLQLARSQLDLFSTGKAPQLPEDFWVNHIASTFVETLRWWLAQRMTQSAETITQYFLLALHADPTQSEVIL